MYLHMYKQFYLYGICTFCVGIYTVKNTMKLKYVFFVVGTCITLLIYTVPTVLVILNALK